MRRVGVFAVCGVVLLAAGCATTQSRFAWLDKQYPARAETCDLEIFRTGQPARHFVRISRLDVHLEKTHFIGSGFDDALPDLKRQACLSGADAVIEINETTSSHAETRIYHVTATGIRFQ
jgi:hypothetical protein